MTRLIRVFGSNQAGRHGAGYAKYCREHHGAIYGQGVGLQGDSYGIPTKDYNIQPLPLSKIKPYVKEFLHFAEIHPELEFEVSAIGCGLRGLTPADMAPMFSECWGPRTKYRNVKLNAKFLNFLSEGTNTDENLESLNMKID